MPPQSRGQTADAASLSSNKPMPHVLRPYLENLPDPTTMIGDQRTPTGPYGDGSLDRSTPTPTRRHHFEIGDEKYEEEEEDEEDGQERDELHDVTLDDDDFQSHYSRHSSPASSSEGSEQEGSELQIEEEDGEVHDGGVQNEFIPRTGPLQRISSMPASSVQAQQQSMLQTSQSTSNLRPVPPLPPPLYPPFYNRPPTPLPPSPSLTSLLRPPSLLNRSTTSTRPTTPDSSDVETPNDTEAAVAHSARRANPPPPTSPKVPTYEYYGFVLYLASSLAFLMYLLWSYLPSPILHAIGITYYPNRWWSLALPAWIVMALIFVYIALLSYNVEYLTLPLASLECMVDDAGNVAILDEQGHVRRGGSKRFVGDMEAKRKRAAERRRISSTKAGNTSGGSKAARRREKERQLREDEEQENENWWGFPEGSIAQELNWKHIWNEGTDAVMDVPIGGVCRVLYSAE